MSVHATTVDPAKGVRQLRPARQISFSFVCVLELAQVCEPITAGGLELDFEAASALPYCVEQLASQSTFCPDIWKLLPVVV